jgi:hypothetical protein
MRTRTRVGHALLAIAGFILSSTPGRAQIPDWTQYPYPPPSPPATGGGTQPPSTSPIDDHTYTGIGTLQGRDLVLKLERAVAAGDRGEIVRLLESARDQRVPYSLVGLSAQLVANGSTTFSAPELLYANNPGHYFVGFQPFVAGEHGFAVSAGYDFSGDHHDLVARARVSNQRILDLYSVRSRPGDDLVDVVRARLVAALRTTGGTVEAFNESVVGLRAGVSLNYRRFEDLGSSVQGNLSISKLYRLTSHRRTTPGVLWLASAGGIGVSPERDPDTAAFHNGLRVALQDRVPFIEEYTNPAGERRVRMVRWKRQIGFDYTFENEATDGDAWAVFLRYRHEPVPKDPESVRDYYKRFWEFTVSAGKAADDDWVFRLKVGKFFAF